MAGLNNGLTPEDLSIVIFGASGDLCGRKLMPALYHLYETRCLPENFSILGFARSGLSRDAFRAHLEKQFRYGAGDFFAHVDYLQGDYEDPQSYQALSERLKQSPPNRLFYLATPPEQMCAICQHVGEISCRECSTPFRCEDCPRGRGWTRLILEKPFGHDVGSAHQLNTFLMERFGEKQIFRIDHYLGKETVQNLLVFRFANNIFEPLWSSRFIDYLEVHIAEELGVENRGTYFDKAGIVRDIVQNHALQLLSLVAMEPPANFSAEAIRNEKVKLLSCLAPLNGDEVRQKTLRAQYQGYREEKGVNPESQTETFAVIKLAIDNWRWAGIPIYIRVGKALSQKVTAVRVHFKKVPVRLFHSKSQDSIAPNILTFRIQPEEGIQLLFQTKVPGSSFRVSPVEMDFSYHKEFTNRITDAYERLLLDAMINDASLFIRQDEVAQSWRFVDSILKVWEASGDIPLYHYERGRAGPDEIYPFIEKDGNSWAKELCRLKK